MYINTMKKGIFHEKIQWICDIQCSVDREVIIIIL